MGCCMSSESSSSSADYSSTSRRHRKPSANVVSLTGELRQYPLPVTVSQVLQSETTTTTTSSPDSFFICNSDRLYFDDYIPSLEAQEELESGQIYFVLPISKLDYRLAASDMAALAVKASVALEKINAASNQSRRNRKSRISPVLVSEDPLSDHNHQVQIKSSTSSSSSVNYYYRNNNSASATRSSTAGLGVSRSGSVRRKLTRYSSRRAKLAVRSFRIKLNTIYEGSVLLLN